VHAPGDRARQGSCRQCERGLDLLRELVAQVKEPTAREDIRRTIPRPLAKPPSIERVEELQSLNEEIGTLHAILNTAVDAIITIDEQGIIQSVNPAAERMFGYKGGEMVGQNVSKLMPSPYREQHDQYLRRYLETGKARIIGIGREVAGRRKDGSTFPADLSVSQVHHVKLFTGIIRDITRNKNLERDVVEIASMQQRRIGEDLHDRVGQELTALNMLVSDLAESVHTDPEQAVQVIERIAQGLRRSQPFSSIRNVAKALSAAFTRA
jgi:PAS domain S-box-containing protein